MLILPLHKPLDLDNLPWLTLLLVLANVLVFAMFQAGDSGRIEQVHAYYVDSGLAGIELPAYERYLRESGRDEQLAELQELPAPQRPGYLAMQRDHDTAFGEALASGALLDADAAWQWQRLHGRYDTLMDGVFTLRHHLRNSEWSPRRMLSAAFLHGDVMHLVGNMVFLLALGVLLEGALGPARLLGVYLLGAIGASAASLLWRWGEVGGGLGASGAIAALMGAFCVVWGRRPVRFFYWFGVIFDYVRAPAILLLPLWLGWELFNLFFGEERGIGFDAHAGGLICGALLGGALVAMRQTRQAFMQDGELAAPADDRWARAQRHLGRMENAEAEALLAELAAGQPDRFDIVLARCRVARNGGNPRALGERSLQLLSLAAADASQAQAQRAALQDLDDAGAEVPPTLRLGLAQRWSGLGLLHEAERLLLDPRTASGASAPLAQALLSLAMRHAEQQAQGEQRRVLGLLLERYPDQPQAAKARFLIENA
jgi:membrane associated rhomboid family serine protease